MKTRVQAKKFKQAVLALEKAESIPKDLSDRELLVDDEPELYEYFSSKDGNNIIKRWSLLLAKDPFRCFRELLSIILQISGNRINITTEHIESDTYDIVLEEFQRETENKRFDPPIFTFTKDKKNTLNIFCREISEALISNESLMDISFPHFKEWLIILNCCKIRVIRLTTSYFIFAFYESLAKQTNKRLADITMLNGKNANSKKVKQQITAFEQEVKVYSSIMTAFFQTVLVIRFRDVDDQIRMMAINSLTEAIIKCPTELCDEQKLKYIGRGFNDLCSQNRSGSLKCFNKLYTELWGLQENISVDNNDKNNDNIGGYKEMLKELAEKYNERILEMCDDKDNAVVADALESLSILDERGLLSELDCQHTIDMLSDNSIEIRTNAANFVSKHYFNDENNNLEYFLQFCTKFEDIEVPAVVHSLYPHMKCLRKWDKMCDMLATESDETNSLLLSKILLYSAERACGKNDVSSSKEIDKPRIRKLTLVLVKSLQQLIKAYQSEEDIVINLVEATRLLDLDAISDNTCDQLYQKLLGEIRDLFLGSNNKQIFTAAIYSLYELSKNKEHQLSEYAKHEIDRLAVEYSANLKRSFDSLGNNRLYISKFAAAARLVDVSDNGKFRQLMLDYLEKANEEKDEDLTVECLECLHCFLKWEIKRVHNDDMLKNEYYDTTFIEYLDLFTIYLKNGNGNVAVHAFKGLSSAISLSTLLFPLEKGNVNIKNEIIQKFFKFFHKNSEKNELFEYAVLPIQTHSIDIEYAAHLLVYQNHSEDLQKKTRVLWKELAPFKPLDGHQAYYALRNADIDVQQNIKTAARSFVGKIRAFDFITEWSKNGEDENLLPAVLLFMVGLSKEEATQLKVEQLSERFDNVLEALSNGDKPTQKMIMQIMNRKEQHLKNKKNAEFQGDNEAENQENDTESDPIQFEEPEDTFIRFH